jgi:hypothetical protein
MAFLKVRVLYKGARYSAEIDDSVDPRVLAKQLAEDIDQASSDGDYRLALYDEVAVRDGSTLELVDVPTRGVRSVRPEH